MKVAVTGGLGFIGGHVCEALVARGTPVVAIDQWDGSQDARRESMVAIRRVGGMFRYCHGDVRDQAFLRHVFDQERVSAVIHLAAYGGVRASWARVGEYMGLNVGGTGAVLAAAAASGVSRVVVASSNAVYGTSRTPFREDDRAVAPISPYGVSKLVMEQVAGWYAREHHLRVALLRYFTVYGPRQRGDSALAVVTRHWIQDQAAPIYGSLEQVRDWIAVTDAATATIQAMDVSHEWAYGRCEVLNIGRGRPVRFATVLQQLREALGVTGPVREAPREPGDLQVTFADTTKAKHLLTWEARVDLPAGLAAFAAWATDTNGRRVLIGEGA